MKTNVLIGAHGKSPLKYHYKLKEGKFKDTRHFQSTYLLNKDRFLTDLLNISRNRFFNKSNARYLARLRVGNKWNKKILTGLFDTQYKGIYYGDIEQKKHFIVFVFPNKDKEILVFIYPNFYPFNKTLRDKIINQIATNHLV